jgi:hypothetical protein
MHHVKPISALTHAEMHDLAIHAAERGECVEDVNPFPDGTPEHRLFAAAFEQRATDLLQVA